MCVQPPAARLLKDRASGHDRPPVAVAFELRRDGPFRLVTQPAVPQQDKQVNTDRDSENAQGDE